MNWDHVALKPALEGGVCCEGYALGWLAYADGAGYFVVAAVRWVLVVEVPLACWCADDANVLDRVCHGVLSEVSDRGCIGTSVPLNACNVVYDLYAGCVGVLPF